MNIVEMELILDTNQWGQTYFVISHDYMAPNEAAKVLNLWTGALWSS